MRLISALIIGLVMGMAAAYAAPTLDWGFVVNAAAPSSRPMQWVDRTHKGDRLDRAATRVGKQPTPAPKLLVGCEPVSSPLSSVQATIPGRCAA